MRRANSIRITPPVHHEKPPIAQPTEGDPLTQDSLQQYWNTLIGDLQESNKALHDLLANRTIEYKDNDLFDIVADSSYFEEEFRPHRVAVLERLRHMSRRPNVNCQVRVEYVETEYAAYIPRDKYEVMQATNPQIASFRVVFPEIDF